VENEENQNQVSLRFPPPLEIAAAIPTFPQPLRRVEKWKTKSRFSTFPLVVLSLKSNQERKPGGGSLRSRLQAHSSMRKCWTCAAGGEFQQEEDRSQEPGARMKVALRAFFL